MANHNVQTDNILFQIELRKALDQALTQPSEQTLTTEPENIKVNVQRQMAKTALHIPIKDSHSDAILDAYQTVYMTGFWDRVGFVLRPAKNKVKAEAYREAKLIRACNEAGTTYFDANNWSAFTAQANDEQENDSSDDKKSSEMKLLTSNKPDPMNVAQALKIIEEASLLERLTYSYAKNNNARRYAQAKAMVEDNRRRYLEPAVFKRNLLEDIPDWYAYDDDYLYLKAASRGWYYFFFSYLLSDDLLSPQFKEMRAEYSKQFFYNYSDLKDAVKNFFAGGWYWFKSSFVDLPPRVVIEKEPRTEIERARKRIKDKISAEEKAAMAELSNRLDDIAAGSPLSDDDKERVFTDAFKHAVHGFKTVSVLTQLDDDLRTCYQSLVTLISAETNAEKKLEFERKRERIANLGLAIENLKQQQSRSHLEAKQAIKKLLTLYAEAKAELMYGNAKFYEKIESEVLENGVRVKKLESNADRFYGEMAEAYAQTLANYYANLKARHERLNSALYQRVVHMHAYGDREADEIVLEYQRLNAKDELELARFRQEYLKRGLLLAMRFAIGCGFFSAGAWAMLIAGFAPAWVAGVALLFCLGFAYCATVMNYLSSNYELFKPFFKTEVDRGRLKDDRHILVKLWHYFKYAEYSPKGAARVVKHFSNETTGFIWGLLTALGVLSLGYALPSIFYPDLFRWGGALMYDIAPLGLTNVNVLVVAILGVIGLGLGYVTYKVFGLLVRLNGDKVLENGPRLEEDYYKELFLVSTINNKQHPTLIHYVKQTATLFGILLTAMASITVLGDLIGSGTGVRLGLGFMGVDATIALSALLAFSIILVAFYGLKDFYILRSRTSVLKGQAGNFGGRVAQFDEDQIEGMDPAALAAPDFHVIIETGNPKRNLWAEFVTYFFATGNIVTPERVRRVNAISQAGPSVWGGISLGLTAISGALYLMGAASAAAAGIGITIGVLGGICAAVASYQANGVDERAIVYNITDDIVLWHELRTIGMELGVRGTEQLMQAKPSATRASDRAQTVAAALKAISNYAYTREKSAADHYWMRDNFCKADKVGAARFIVDYFVAYGKVCTFTDLVNLSKRESQLDNGGVFYLNGEHYGSEQLKKFSGAMTEPGSQLKDLYEQLLAVERMPVVNTDAVSLEKLKLQQQQQQQQQQQPVKHPSLVAV